MEEQKKLILSAMEEQKKSELVSEAKGLARFFECDICIKLFGFIIWEWHFPPKS